MSADPLTTPPDPVAKIRRALDLHRMTEMMRQEGTPTSEMPRNVEVLVMQVLLENVPLLLARFDALEAENQRLTRELDECCK